MIPKKIHYCWFGYGEKPEIIKKCIASRKKYCPDFEIIEWNETNFDINECDYCKEAYDSKKWAFVSDYARLKILKDNGGIYLDTDVELLKPLDNFLTLHAFMALEHGNKINTGLITGSESQHPAIDILLDYYLNNHFKTEENKLDLTTCVTIATDIFLKHGFVEQNIRQNVLGVEIFETEYFCPKNQFTGKVILTENTYAIHHYDGSWADETTKYGQKMKKELIVKYNKVLGNLIYAFKYSFYVIKKDGLLSLFKKINRKIVIIFKKKI